jgi:signal transduction histidine kinase
MFTALALLMVLFGGFVLWRFGEANAASEQIRDRWLVATRLLGDLNNTTSDYRAAEASHLLSQSRADMARIDSEITALHQAIVAAELGVQALPQPLQDPQRWRDFLAEWVRYEAVAARVVELSRAGLKPAGTALYLGESLRSYGAASDALEALTAQTVTNAKEASNRSEQIFRTARVVIVLATALLVGLGALLLTHIRRAIVDPILELASRMNALAANDMDISDSGAERADEIGEMARAIVVFRDNAIELAHSRRGLEQQARMMAEKLESERRLTDQHRNFVSMASHEFRTPLTVIDGQAQRLIRLAENRDGGQDVIERARKMRLAVRRMTTLIDRLMNSLQVMEGAQGLYFHPGAFSLADTLHEVCQTYREITPGAHIVEHLRRAPQRILGDPALLYQALGNLLSNAIKYSPDGSLIELSAWSEAGAAVITVSDCGIGIPEAERSRLFERSFRGSNVGGTVGAGIGLFLVKTVIDLHGGTLSVTSREREGSRFEIRLPLEASTTPRASAHYGTNV